MGVKYDNKLYFENLLQTAKKTNWNTLLCFSCWSDKSIYGIGPLVPLLGQSYFHSMFNLINAAVSNDLCCSSWIPFCWQVWNRRPCWCFLRKLYWDRGRGRKAFRLFIRHILLHSCEWGGWLTTQWWLLSSSFPVAMYLENCTYAICWPSEFT